MMHAQRPRVPAAALCAGLLLLAACGVSSGTFKVTQTPAGTTTATSGATDCGHVSASGAVQGTGGAPSTAETCFANAYAQCTPATLVYTQFGVDAGVVHTLRIAHSSGVCLITDDAQSYSVVTIQGTSEPTLHYTCSAVESFHGGIRVRQCGAEGDIVIPSGA